MKRFFAAVMLALALCLPRVAQSQEATKTFLYENCQPLFCVNATIKGTLTFGVPPWRQWAGETEPVWYYEGIWHYGLTGVTYYRLNGPAPFGSGDQFFSITLAESFPEFAYGRATFATDFTPTPVLTPNLETCEQPIGSRTCGPTSVRYDAIPISLVSVTTTPEPATLPLIGFGLLALAATARRRLV